MEADKSLLDQQRLRIASQCSVRSVPPGNASGAVSSFTELGLIKHEAGKKSRHISVRALFRRAAKAVTDLKPCFMMSPMSVAQFLEPGQFMFDVLIIDEASQVRPEDAIGAIGRARQVVIVVDPKQLPPTNFFSRAEEESEDESTEISAEQAESILDTVQLDFPTRQLRWHYRSRHQSLIDFSNRSFYDSNLVVFPSPQDAGEEFGIRYERVDGTFVDRLNEQEAIRIVDFICTQVQSRPDETVGVVAMNSKQAQYIEDLFEKRSEEDLMLAAAMTYEAQAREPLFIKNLERVQGDERDVIVMSMTYGPTVVGGVTPQRFGPINSDLGWRRLNVLLTRSRCRMHVFSSMSSHDVRVNAASSSRGILALRDFLKYCETGTTAGSERITKKEPDSDFERSVIRRIEAYGYKCEPQLGVAGYFLDLAVRNPDNLGQYLLGIECDGASYHSAKSARDRDRLRQQVLEDLGRKLHRIWSTDWFQAPDAQMHVVLSVHEQARADAGGVGVAGMASGG